MRLSERSVTMVTKFSSLRGCAAATAVLILVAAIAPRVGFAQAPSGTLPAPAPRPSGTAPAQTQAPAAPAPTPSAAPAQPGTPAPAQAQRAAAPSGRLAPTVVGIIDMGIISRDAAAYKSLRAQLDSQSKAWDAELKKKSDDLRKLEDDFRKQGPSLTPEQVTEKRKQFETQMGDYQRQLNSRRRQLADGEAQSAQPIDAALTEILQQIAVERSINLIIPRAATVLFSSEIDVTADSLQRLNAKLPRVALKLPPPQSATPATPPKSN